MVNEDHESEKRGAPFSCVSRRGFLESVGIGMTGIAVTRNLSAADTEELTENGKAKKLSLMINGGRHSFMTEPRMSLLHVLREKLGMTGTKPGCERGECGACTVLIDGKSRYSCLTLAVEAEDHDVTTIEGLRRGEKLGAVQQAFLEKDAFQCGYCTPGQIMAAEGLLRSKHNPSDEEIREGMSGNLCRCGAYQHIFQAVRRAAELKKEKGLV
jgi:xanthine dehydrogenase YagT iron-sulfur-binding subunit